MLLSVVDSHLTLSVSDILSPDPPVSPGSSDLHSAPLTAMHGSSQDVIRGIYIRDVHKCCNDNSLQLNGRGYNTH